MTRGRESVLAALVLAPIALLAGVIVIGAATRNEGPRTPIRRDSPETTGETADSTPDADSPEAPAAESSAVDEPIGYLDEFSQTDFRTALADKPPFGNDETRAVCGKRTNCRVLRKKSGGSDMLGRAIRLVSVLNTYGAGPQRLAVEHWALLSAAGSIVDRQLLFRDAPAWPNDTDEKKAELLPASLTVSGGILSYPVSYVGFGWRSMARYQTYEVSLDDLRLVHGRDTTTWHGSRTLSVDFDAALATETWKMPACTYSWNKRPASEGSGVAIPLIAVEGSFAANWRTTELNPCARKSTAAPRASCSRALRMQTTRRSL